MYFRWYIAFIRDATHHSFELASLSSITDLGLQLLHPTIFMVNLWFRFRSPTIIDLGLHSSISSWPFASYRDSLVLDQLIFVMAIWDSLSDPSQSILPWIWNTFILIFDDTSWRNCSSQLVLMCAAFKATPFLLLRSFNPMCYL